MEVINVRKAILRKNGYQDLEDWLKNPNHIYIGRNMTVYVPGWLDQNGEILSLLKNMAWMVVS